MAERRQGILRQDDIVIRTLVHGSGRMARRVLAQMPDFGNLQLAGIVARSEPVDLAEVQWYGTFDECGSEADLLIDFTLPGGTRAAADWCERKGVALLSGTTGLADEDKQALKNAALKVPVLWAPNLSYGVALVKNLVRQAAATLGTGADVHVADTHHRHKVDAPSGTALALAESVMEGRQQNLRNLLDQESPERLLDGDDGGLTFSSVREGEVIGDHTVSFTLPNEVIEITHRALDRDVFANGALKAGEWLVGQAPGYYSTSDWLGLN